MLELWPNDPKILYSISKAYAKNNQYNMVMNPLKKGMQIDPKGIGDMLKIGNLVLEQGNKVLAKEIYNHALEYDNSIKVPGTLYE